VSHAQPLEMLEKAFRSGESTDPKAARGIVPRIPLPQELLSKLPQTFDCDRTAHLLINLIISLSARTNLSADACASISRRGRLGLSAGGVLYCDETSK